MRNIPAAPDHDIELSGGALALDFANTVGGTHVSPTHDHLRSYGDIVRSAVDLLTSGERDRVKECASATCEWVFLDRSKNHSRRWCDMSDCGNRAKARRFHAKRQAARA